MVKVVEAEATEVAAAVVVTITGTVTLIGAIAVVQTGEGLEEMVDASEVEEVAVDRKAATGKVPVKASRFSPVTFRGSLAGRGVTSSAFGTNRGRM